MWKRNESDFFLNLLLCFLITGRVLPIGGVKEKTIGARRSGITTLIFPRNNKKDWDELPAYITDGAQSDVVWSST